MDPDFVPTIPHYPHNPVGPEVSTTAVHSGNIGTQQDTQSNIIILINIVIYNIYDSNI